MAELVDALVSNTSGFFHAGSIPALGTEKSLIEQSVKHVCNYSAGLSTARQFFGSVQKPCGYVKSD